MNMSYHEGNIGRKVLGGMDIAEQLNPSENPYLEQKIGAVFSGSGYGAPYPITPPDMGEDQSYHILFRDR